MTRLRQPRLATKTSEKTPAEAVEEHAGVAQEAAEAADEAADRADEAAAEARDAADSSAEIAHQIDDATALVVDDDPPYADVTPDTTRVSSGSPLLRHSPFNIGFFGALGALVALFLTEQIFSISSILILLVMAMFLAIGLNPVVEAFMKRGVRRGLAVLGVLAVVLGVLAMFVGAVAPVIGDQIALITSNAPGWLDDLEQNKRIQELDTKYDVLDKVRDYVQDGDFGQRVFGGALGVGLAVLSTVANTLIVLVLMIYFLVSLPSIKHAAYSLAPASRRPRVSELGDKIIRSTGAYVAGAFLVAIFAGISTLVFSFVVGLGDYAFALAFIVGLLSLIPVVGAFVSGAIMTLLALTVSPTVALVALAYYLAYQQIESYFIYPRIMQRSVDIPGSMTVVAALVGGAMMGIVGALLAVPVAAALLLLHREVFLKRQDAR
ncbi:AI-2E family transporter [Nocardioides seonyuensis]|uniref:AI-2E family transporter n=1 Tax=Nocardioides seonyuensis TaxID=2518371 RepID=A0A4P7IGY0_9ACTN|nr:AI-2E family transporter [Nocardioides seonyuensis]QBX56528.1 AI-2E family transporter [Nocardioides seonyuensis]